VSAADAVSDAYMINEFYVMGKMGTANGLLAMVGANLGFQVIVTYAQTQGLKKDKWRTALFEMLAVVTFSKPGLDAYRVASGAEQLTGAAMNPLMEMIYVKGGELVFEAIPG
jgi:predicted polyphosphate/ATP-dependent NAD kinase